MVGFAYLAYEEFQSGNTILALIFVLLALIFQPLFKIAMGRDMWQVVDFVAATGLVISIFISNKIT
jgi:hypothetical protein